MIRMSRAGRKRLMLKALERFWMKNPTGFLPTPAVAHAAGLMSSTNVVNMLHELENDDLIVGRQIEPKAGCGYTVQAWSIARWEQKALPDDRYIMINGQYYNLRGEMINV